MTPERFRENIREQLSQCDCPVAWVTNGAESLRPRLTHECKRASAAFAMQRAPVRRYSVLLRLLILLSPAANPHRRGCTYPLRNSPVVFYPIIFGDLWARVFNRTTIAMVSQSASPRD